MGENTATCDMSCVHVWQSTVLKGWPRNFANRKVLLSFRILHQGNSVSTSASRLLRCKDARTHMVLVNSTPHDHGKKKVCENIDPGAGGPCCGDAWITGIAEQVTPPTLAKHKGSLQTWTWKSWLFWCLATFYTFATSKSWEKNHSIIFRTLVGASMTSVIHIFFVAKDPRSGIKAQAFSTGKTLICQCLEHPDRWLVADLRP